MQAHSLQLVVKETSRQSAVSMSQRAGLGDHCGLLFKLAVEIDNDRAALASFRVHECADLFHGSSAIGLESSTHKRLCCLVAS
jgi:hypothetical protein